MMFREFPFHQLFFHATSYTELKIKSDLNAMECCVDPVSQPLGAPRAQHLKTWYGQGAASGPLQTQALKKKKKLAMGNLGI